MKNVRLVAFLLGLFCSLDEAVNSQDENDLKLLGAGYLLDVDRLQSLDLSDDQKREIKEATDKINADSRRKSEQHMKTFGSGKRDPKAERKNLTPDELISRAIQEEKRRESSSQRFESKANAQIRALIDILLPHQRKKLVGLRLWNVRDFSFATLLEQRFVQAKLKMTPKQIESIQPSAGKLQKEFEEEVEKLKQSYRKRLMSKVMTDKQRDDFKKIMGENIGMKGEVLSKF